MDPRTWSVLPAPLRRRAGALLALAVDVTIHELELRHAAATDIGRRRKVNEDVALARPDLGLFLVADGAGGHEAGDVAADAAVRAVVKFFEAHASSPPESTAQLVRLGIEPGARRLAAALHRAHRAVVDVARAADSQKGMGSTLVAAYFSSPEVLHVAHVGDSRCYRMRSGHLELLTVDHSIASDVLEKRPELDDTVLAKLPTNVVTRALGMGESLRVGIQSWPVVAGDRFLLCSDGLSTPLSASTIAEIMNLEPDASAAVATLIALANEAGGPDNIAVVVIDCPGGAEQALPVERISVADDEPSHRSSDPELLIVGIEELDLSGALDEAGDDLIRALSDALHRHDR